MNRTTLNITVRITAAFLLTVGVLAMGRAVLAQQRQRSAIQQTLEQLKELQRLETVVAEAFAPVMAWGQAADEPLSLRGLLRELELERNVEIREQRTLPMALPGWNMRRAEMSVDALTPAELWYLINRSQSSEYPWRLGHIELTVIADTPAMLAARLRFETAVPR